MSGGRALSSAIIMVSLLMAPIFAFQAASDGDVNDVGATKPGVDYWGMAETFWNVSTGTDAPASFGDMTLVQRTNTDSVVLDGWLWEMTKTSMVGTVARFSPSNPATRTNDWNISTEITRPREDSAYISYGISAQVGNQSLIIYLTNQSGFILAGVSLTTGSYLGESIQEVAFSVRLDDLVTQAEVLGTEGCNNWHLSPVEVSLSVVRTEYAVSLTSHRIDYSEWHNYSGPFEIHDEGAHVIEFYSEDLSGNVEDIQMLEVKIDYTAPVMNIMIEDGHIFDEGNVQISWTCEDLCSGIDRIEYSLDEEAFVACSNSTGLHLSDLSNGKHSLMIRLHDQAGNNLTEELMFEVRVASSRALPDPWILVYILMLASATAVSVFFLRKKRGGRRQHPSESSEGIYDSRSLMLEVHEK